MRLYVCSREDLYEYVNMWFYNKSTCCNELAFDIEFK